MTAIALSLGSGLDAYLEAVEHRLQSAVSRYPGLAAEAAGAAEGGKRLRPLLVYLAAPLEDDAPRRGGVAVELVHMATLVHDDLIDGADLRHGRPSVWSLHGAATAVASGDYLFARGFAELASTGDTEAGDTGPRGRLAVRGEALQRRPATIPTRPSRATWSGSRSRRGSCSRRLPAGWPDRAGRIRSRSRHRLPDRGRRPRLRRRLTGHGKVAGPTCAKERRPCR